MGAAGAGVAEFVVLGVGGGLCLLDLFAGAGAGVDQAAGLKGAEGLAVGGEVVGLVRGGAVPVDAQPAEVVEGGGGGFGFDAWAVEVFDAEGKLPGVASGQGPVDEEGAGVAQVQGTGGRGG